MIEPIHTENIDKYEEILNDWVKKFPRSYFKKIHAKDNKCILDYINSKTPLLQDSKYLISTKVYWVLHHMTEFPKCCICGRKIDKNVKINEGYPSHCSAKCLSQDSTVQQHKEESYQRKYGEGIVNPFMAKEVKDRISKTNLEKYGTKTFTQTDEYKGYVDSIRCEMECKKNDTHRKNNSFHVSKTEDIVFSILKRKFKDIERNYSSEEYPYVCDFYIPDLKMYIEYNGTWTHGGKYFDKDNINDINKLNEWRSKDTKYYDNAIYTWTDLDPRKKYIAEKNKLNYKVFWNIDEVYDFVFGKEHQDNLGLSVEIRYDRKKIEREFQYYKTIDVQTLPHSFPNRNYIIKYFQQDTFFKTEKDIWKNDAVKREKLVLNRQKYLDKHIKDLTPDDILTGFKKSGIHYGYSHFNPLWFKWFLKEYNINTCYDPCGGWGHRLLGALDIEKYIYNDLSKSTKDNVDRIIDFFNIKNTMTYNNDARTFIPEDDFEAMFTCPPYYNIEHYECGDFEDRKDFEHFIDSLFDVFHSKKSCRIFGLVIREDLLPKNHRDYVNAFEIGENKEKYLNKINNNSKEFVFIFCK